MEELYMNMIKFFFMFFTSDSLILIFLLLSTNLIASFVR